MTTFRKTIRLIVCFIFWGGLTRVCFAQQEATSLNMLLSPGAPGFVLLGVEPSSVERPGNVTDFGLNILNNTNGLSALPQNYAVEVAPYWLFGHPYLSYNDYSGDNGVISTVEQTFSISLATSSKFEGAVDTLSTGMGIGVRFSLLQGQIDVGFDNYKSKLDSVVNDLGGLNHKIDSVYRARSAADAMMSELSNARTTAANRNDSALVALIDAQRTARDGELRTEAENEIRSQNQSQIQQLKSLVTSIQLRRLGWKLDVAGGVVLDFPKQSFDNSSLTKEGGWITGGYELQNYSLLAVVRYLVDAKNSAQTNLDAGGRFIVPCSPTWTLSGEALYRSFTNQSNSSSWKFDVEIDYTLAKNSAVSFTFGRDSQGSQTGTLLSALNFIFGFGSQRP